MTLGDWAAVAGIFAILWLVMLSPLLVPLYLALRGGSSVPRRWLFVFLAACSAYGFVVLLLVVLAYPVEFIVSFVAPNSSTITRTPASWLPPSTFGIAQGPGIGGLHL